ncbi:BTAD domain-containing putative transcriptional regulator [Sphaerisporangium dianthi]|uniref:BTAD domain-containing putative transcriptional regulator n=1 Tax=Sphaerisporangium dianthi TaxID=1436120 RepID=A0ABV9CTQ9_9ACTN
MRFGVLGPVTVWTGDGALVTVPGLKVRALLAALLVDEGRPVSADRLVEHLWGDRPPGNPSGTLSAKVSQLRRALEDAEPGGRDLVVSPPPGYLLRAGAGEVDAHRFASLTAEAREAPDARARATLLSGALALWRGPAFAGFADEPFARATVARLEEQRLTALEDLAEARLALGMHAVVAGDLGDHVARHPLRERPRALHMLALYRDGRQAEALDSYDELRVHLAEELGLDPGPEVVALHRSILAQNPALGGPVQAEEEEQAGEAGASGAPARPRTNLPTAIAGIIGREDAVAEVRASLEHGRLVTLTGSGGVGKTRLAMEVAAPLAEAYPDGVWLAELGALDRPGASNVLESLTDLLMAVLDVRDVAGPREPAAPIERLVRALRTRRMLLVLDNCEHVIDEVAELAAALLRAAPGLRVLATSREPLGLAGEVVWPVPPLDVPHPGQADPATLERFGAVKLFVDRAGAAARGFTLTSENADAVALLCRRLDGIPLALELAATRVRALGIRGLVAGLDDRFRLLATGHRGAPPRQQTLMAMIDWSWQLLTPAERTVLRRLAVHADGCTLEAAQAVCAGNHATHRTVRTPSGDHATHRTVRTPSGDHATHRTVRTADGDHTTRETARAAGGGDGVPVEEVPELLARLVDRSLVVMTDRGDEAPRYRLLESVAAYCADRMDEAGELRQVSEWHRVYYTALAESAEPHLYGPGQGTWLRRLDAEAANLRAALDSALRDGDAGLALRLVNALTWYWFLRGRLDEARRSLQAALDTAAGGPPPLAAGTAAGGPSPVTAGTAAGGPPPLAAGTAAGGSSPVAPDPGGAPFPAARARAVTWHTGVSFLLGDIDGWPARHEAALRAYDGADDPLGRARAEWFLAFAEIDLGDVAATGESIGRSLAAFEAAGDEWGVAAALSLRAKHAHVRGDAAALERDGARSAALFRELGDRWGLLQATEWLGAHAGMTGDHERANRLHLEGLRIAADLGLWTDVSGRLSWLGWIAMQCGDHRAARVYCEEGLELATEQASPLGAVFAEMGLAFAARRQGDLDVAEAHLRNLAEAVDRQDTGPGRPLYAPSVLAELGYVAELRGDAATALARHSEAFAVALDLDTSGDVALALSGLAGACALAGRHGDAARLLGAAAAVREAAGIVLTPAEEGDTHRTIGAARAALGEDAFARLFAHGRALRPEQARSLLDGAGVP